MVMDVPGKRRENHYCFPELACRPASMSGDHRIGETVLTKLRLDIHVHLD